MPRSWRRSGGTAISPVSPARAGRRAIPARSTANRGNSRGRLSATSRPLRRPRIFHRPIMRRTSRRSCARSPRTDRFASGSARTSRTAPMPSSPARIWAAAPSPASTTCGFEIEYFDRQLGRILAELERTGELDNTIVVVTSDNGMPFPRVKGAAYAESMHMPLAIRWGRGVAQPGRTVGGYVSFIDFAPTFLELAGLTAAEAGMAPVQGRSLVPLLTRAAGADGADRLIFGQERHDVGRPDDTGYPIRGLMRDGFFYLRNFEPSRWPLCDPVTGYLNTDGGPTKTLILAQNRLGINHWIWDEELYDLKADPACLRNLASDPEHQTRLTAMWRELSTELAAQHDPRMAGQGAVFDRYPNAGSAHDFYTRRILHGEKVPAYWVEETDFEKPDFDPERPLTPDPEP
ncbi:MAG: sulfatase-like hydrolase/transferase [Opitutae bacterium]|nr:sulfatase-like hydrolase/transferase [Opitutae bacterium]